MKTPTRRNTFIMLLQEYLQTYNGKKYTKSELHDMLKATAQIMKTELLDGKSVSFHDLLTVKLIRGGAIRNFHPNLPHVKITGPIKQKPKFKVTMNKNLKKFLIDTNQEEENTK